MDCINGYKFLLINKNLAVTLAFTILVACGGGGGGEIGVPAGPANTDSLPADSSRFAQGVKDDYFTIGGAWSSGNPTASVTDNDFGLVYDSIFGATFIRTGPNSGAANLPPSGTRRIWQDGWTGLGTNILIIDDFYSTDIQGSISSTHGYKVAYSVFNTAPRANLFAYESSGPFSSVDYGTSGLRDINGLPAPLNTPFQVINLSRGVTPDQSSRLLITIQAETKSRTDYFINLAGDGIFTNASDAVITKSAGNEGLLAYTASLEVISVALVTNEDTYPRTLIVGATTDYVTDESQVRLASYSSQPGGNTRIRSNFVVANGATPFSGQLFLNGSMTLPNDAGTSFASPRVAGYVSIVRQKFPNLTAELTVDLMLTTATYRGLMGSIDNEGRSRTGDEQISTTSFSSIVGLTNRPLFCSESVTINCSLSDVYGKGRIDLPAALSPQGSLR